MSSPAKAKTSDSTQPTPNRHCGDVFETVNWQATSFADKYLLINISSTLSALKEKWSLKLMAATIKSKSRPTLLGPLGWSRKAFKCYGSGIMKS